MPANILDLSKNGTQSIVFLTDRNSLSVVQSGKVIELDHIQATELYHYIRDYVVNASVESSFNRVGEV